MNEMRIIVAAIAIVIMSGAPASAQQARHFGYPYDTFLIKSEHVDQTFEIHVSVPPACRSEEAKCPAVYFADADMVFGAVADMSTALNWAKSGIPPLILVGIGYSGDRETSNVGKLRARDLVMLSDEEIETIARQVASKDGGSQQRVEGFGKGAPNFLKFIRNELIPKIEQDYFVDPDDRVYFGYSAGCWFGQYVLFSEPNTFSRYVIGSGYKESLLDRAKLFAESGESISATLFFSVGLDEPV